MYALGPAWDNLTNAIDPLYIMSSNELLAISSGQTWIYQQGSTRDTNNVNDVNRHILLYRRNYTDF